MRTIVFFICLSSMRCEELPTPSSLLRPRNFNHHAHERQQYLKEVTRPDPTKQGPVLFPNDSPPPPRPPLVVTSRPLIESIAKSDLNILPNNSIAEQSQLNQVAFKPNFLRVNPYQIYPVAAPLYEKAGPIRVPYASIVNQVRENGVIGNRYNDYEERTVLPPIYKTLSDYAENKVLQTKVKHNHGQYDYKHNEPDYGRSYENNELPDGNEGSDYNEGENYAFAYAVKDKKTGDDFSHRQASSGSATNGEYRVRLPDGRMQIVSYTADENGYKAIVRYDNEVPSNNKIDTHTDTDYKYNDNHNHNQAIDYHNGYNNKQAVTNYNYNANIGNDYTQRDFNIKPVKDDYQYTDSKEYYNDYSLEYPNSYDTHRSKFAAFKPTPAPTPNYSTVRPSYEEIKDLFTQKPLDSPNYISDRAVEINAPSTPNYDGVTENVVVIAPKLYTHIRSSTPFADTFTTTPKPFIVTPASYLASTIATIRERIRSSKPILSKSFLNRINKYLTYT